MTYIMTSGIEVAVPSLDATPPGLAGLPLQGFASMRGEKAEVIDIAIPTLQTIAPCPAGLPVQDFASMRGEGYDLARLRKPHMATAASPKRPIPPLAHCG